MYRLYFKRIIDFVVAIVILLFLGPLLLVVALIVPLESRGPVFFKQVRVGKKLKRISVLKFRTMTDEKREVSSVIGRSKGVTRFGYILRRFKIDELPQLINVLKGEMSLVGPRPSVPEQLGQMTEEEKKRYSVRPGLTGLAQVSGNIHLDWKERYRFDLCYVRNISFMNDLRILFRTCTLVVIGEEKFKDKPLHIEEA